jgi:hypothetical protein
MSSWPGAIAFHRRLRLGVAGAFPGRLGLGVASNCGLDCCTCVGPGLSGSRISSGKSGFDLVIAIGGVEGQLLGSVLAQVQDRDRRW